MTCWVPVPAAFFTSQIKFTDIKMKFPNIQNYL